MKWHPKKIADDSYLIQYADIVVGSIKRVDIRWTVEILCSGAREDIKGDFASFLLAMAFVEGVETTLAAMTRAP